MPGGRGLLLGAVGVGFIALAIVTGKRGAVEATLMVLGAGQIAIAILLPRLSEFELGPGGIKTKLAAGDREFAVVFEAEAVRLQRFAYLMAGDHETARTLVEEALGKTRQQQRRLPGDQRGRYALRTLLELLETSEERRWLRGPAPVRRTAQRRRGQHNDRNPKIVEALAQLERPARAAFLLRFDWPLSVDEVADVLGRPVNVVQEEIDAARVCIKPYVEGSVQHAD